MVKRTGCRTWSSAFNEFAQTEALPSVPIGGTAHPTEVDQVRSSVRSFKAEHSWATRKSHIRAIMAEPALQARSKLREQDLAGKVAVVTGTSRGIGRATALNLGSRGCSILGTCSSSSSLHHIDVLSHSIEDIYKNGTQPCPKVVGIAADIQDLSSPKKIADKIASDFEGHLDIFINNAGVASAEKIGELAEHDITKYLTGNVHAPVAMVEEFVKRRQFRANSRIVYISSVRARKAWADQMMYMATKSAGESLCRAWSDAFGGKHPEYAFMSGTTANSVLVGMTETEAITSMPKDIVDKFAEELVTPQSIPRAGKPEDVADVIGLLCSEQARWITGSVVSADGGGVKIL